MVELLAALASCRHEAGALEYAQVFHDAEAGHLRQVYLQLAERLAITLVEPVEEQPATGVGKGLENLLHGPKNR
jgi:hypothetical protein